MPESRADQISKLKQSIATLENQQRTLHVDLTASIQSLRELLSQFEPIQADDRAAGVMAQTAAAMPNGAVVATALAPAPAAVSERPVRITAIENESALGRYLQHTINRNRYLWMPGIQTDGKLTKIKIEKIYITLRANRDRLTHNEEDWLKSQPDFATGDLSHLRYQQRLTLETITASVNEALASYPRLVVLGDPGAGKTTLLRYLALLYARDVAEGTYLVRDRLGLDESGRLPILLPLHHLAMFLRNRPDEGTDNHALLLEFLLKSLADDGLDLPANFFDEFLTNGNAVILLDGLDEVADLERRQRVSRLVELFTAAYPNCRYTITSRLVGYVGSARLAENYVAATLRDFTLADVETFLTRWHRLMVAGPLISDEGADAVAADQAQLMLSAIKANQRIRELAVNPLMLAIMCIVRLERLKLPERRAELYAEAVDALLGKWDEAKTQKVDTAILTLQPLDTGDRRVLLQHIALKMHERQLEAVPADELRRWLVGLFFELTNYRPAAERAADRFLNVLEESTWLLTRREDTLYAFAHPTFQEYLAALAIATRDDYIEYTLKRVPDNWWREVVLLETGTFSMQGPERTAKLIGAIAELKEATGPYHNLVLAAECLRDVGEGRVQRQLATEVQTRLRADLNLDIQQELDRRRPRAGWDNVRRGLQSAKELDRRSILREVIQRKAIATHALVQAGSGYWTMPFGEPEWIKIPAGKFSMGKSGELHTVLLKGFRIARVPITNAQYALFVQASGHAAPRGWEDNLSPKGRESHPVVNVSWHDALAYCEWLSAATDRRVALPSEAEWEKAARGDKDTRAYPWGDAFEATRCNSGELGLGTTTPVGIFLDGASPYGVLDLSGNVWEWTRSLDMEYPYDPDDGREDLSSQEPRVLRGGAFGDYVRYVRCAVRYRGYPDLQGSSVGFRCVIYP